MTLAAEVLAAMVARGLTKKDVLLVPEAEFAFGYWPTHGGVVTRRADRDTLGITAAPVPYPAASVVGRVEGKGGPLVVIDGRRLKGHVANYPGMA